MVSFWYYHPRPRCKMCLAPLGSKVAREFVVCIYLQIMAFAVDLFTLNFNCGRYSQ
uniref:Uncharacterized protein n=1 Tax=Anguilla anguilla TaxID=7936 RepID=A0A0E9S535_ANGAN